jgi:hypothetical protein
MDVPINIPLSKIKLYRIIIISLLFIVIGTFMLVKGSNLMDDEIVKRYIVKIAGCMALLLCSSTLFYALRKIKNLQKGLCITQIGIYDNSSGIDIGIIKWEDIIDLREYDNRRGTKSLAIIVSNPQDYINRASNFWQKNLLRANYKLAKTPIFIAAVSLNINYEKLKQHIVEGFQHYTINKQ